MAGDGATNPLVKGTESSSHQPPKISFHRVFALMAVGMSIMGAKNVGAVLVWSEAERLNAGLDSDAMAYDSTTRDVADFKPTIVSPGSRVDIENPYTRNTLSRVLKRTMDLLVAIPASIFLLPVLAIIAVLVKLHDGGPILFAHKRRGADGRYFKCYKFRSMKLNAQAALAEILASDPKLAAEWAAKQKLDNDPRVTDIGKFLRKSSLDELPQLLNIFRGEMSVVGPRPIVDDELARYGEDIRAYYAHRPGILGLWQISGRSETTYEERVAMDVDYAKKQSFFLDLKIMIFAVPAVLLSRGAV